MRLPQAYTMTQTWGLNFGSSYCRLVLRALITVLKIKRFKALLSSEQTPEWKLERQIIYVTRVRVSSV